MSEDNNDRRYKTNLQGLLQFCTEYTKTEDAPQMEAMPAEKREWLRKALEGMTSNDPIKKMVEALKCLVGSGGDKECESDNDINGVISEGGDETLQENREVALANLIMYCEDLDLANDFYNIGGFEALPKLLQDPHPSIRVATADLIATIAQNNPFIQERILEDAFILPHMLSRAEHEGVVDELRVKCLYAVSCIIRESHKGQDRFNDLGGFRVLKKVIRESKVIKLKIKALFLLRSLCVEREDIKDIVINQGLIGVVVDILRVGINETKDGKISTEAEIMAAQAEEMAISTLHCLVSGHNDKCIVECLKVEDFKGVMEGCQRKWKMMEEGQEQVAQIKNIISSCML